MRGEIKYFVSDAPANTKLETMLVAAFARWQVELWFERARQEAGVGAFVVSCLPGAAVFVLRMILRDPDQLNVGVAGSHGIRDRHQKDGQ